MSALYRHNYAVQASNRGGRAKKSVAAFRLSGLQIFLVVIVAVVGVSYLIQINSLATKGYQIRTLQQQMDSLTQENADLKLQSLTLQSMDSVKGKVGSLDMVAANSVDYMAARPVAVAR